MAAPARQPVRLVLDTKVVVAGLLWNGPPRRLVEMAIGGLVFSPYSSPVLIDELARTLAYPKFASRIVSFGTSIDGLVAQYAALVSLVSPSATPRIVFADADDDHVIAAAVAAQAQLIVTGDRKHLLPIGSHQGIAIIAVREALDRFETSIRS